jgi:hypothetical protein
MTELTPPAEAVAGNLVQAERFLQELNGFRTHQEVQAKASIAQVYATCALVHAVRDLTAAVRALKDEA